MLSGARQRPTEALTLLRRPEPFGIGHIAYSACHHIGKNGLKPFPIQPALQSEMREQMEATGRQHRRQS